MPPYRAARFYNDYVPSFDIYSFTSYPSLSFFRGLMNQAPYYSLNVDEDCNGEPDPLMLGRRINVSFTFDASSIDEQLYLGIMADNDFEVFVNGKEYVSFIHADSSETFPFLYLSFFPISLCGDGNVITIS
ncbi:MAG: hypothetical protein H6766_01230 [Candidatus Peribacteria bacterium]|nr:MAG: hypothetical protein H6766_01230 [Candidatus Peribacteria bacterium]